MSAPISPALSASLAPLASGDGAALGLREAGAILLVSCYELGHQPVGLGSPVAFLERAGFAPAVLDLAVERLDRAKVAAARFIGISVPMHTALRLGLRLLERIRQLNATCHVAFYGLYASLNAEHVFRCGGDSVIGGEYELPLLQLVQSLDEGRTVVIDGVSRPNHPGAPLLQRLPFIAPARGSLPPLQKYAKIEGGGLGGPAGYVEATRGCLHRCLHCPITPVYDGRFFAVPAEVVLQDVRTQVQLGATHITFGDPDFLNGPRHAMQIARALHAEFPNLTFDCTTKVEHILKHRSLFAELRALGCVFVVSAFESLSDDVLRLLDKGHTRRGAHEALAIVQNQGITLRPTWVPFTPWAGLDDFLDILQFVDREGLSECVAPVQYTIRLLVPPGSALLALPEMQRHLGALDEAALTYRWSHPDPRVDRLQAAIASEVAAAEARKEDAAATFVTLKRLATQAAGRAMATALPSRRPGRGKPPGLSEAWFC